MVTDNTESNGCMYVSERESTDPNYQTEEVSSTVIPVAARIGLGTRIFFTENIGANVGVGFGQGGILTAGLSFAF